MRVALREDALYATQPDMGAVLKKGVTTLTRGCFSSADCAMIQNNRLERTIEFCTMSDVMRPVRGWVFLAHSGGLWLFIVAEGRGALAAVRLAVAIARICQAAARIREQRLIL
jgi:hypothetical protein